MQLDFYEHVSNLYSQSAVSLVCYYYIWLIIRNIIRLTQYYYLPAD